jgi:hypothetical protein
MTMGMPLLMRQNYSLLQFLMVEEYQRRTQKGIKRNGKTPKEVGRKTQRVAVDAATGAIDIVRFFCISVKMDFEEKCLTIQKKVIFSIISQLEEKN